MPVTGKGKKSILFVAEAPGAQEDKQGIQLVGDAGQLLRQIIHSIGEELDDCWKTNAVICRPPKNEIDDLYITSCRPNLLRTIKKLKPKVIVLLGISAVKSLISLEWRKNLGPLGKWVGWRIPLASVNCARACPTYHPSYLLRCNKDAVLMSETKKHIKQAFQIEREEQKSVDALDALKKKIEIIKKPHEARIRLRELAKKLGVLAFDYETTGLKPDKKGHRIVSSSFRLEGEKAFACMMDDSCLKLLSKILLNPKLGKVASNIKFEERWTRAILGHGVTNWHWDTMLAAHVLDNRTGITSLKFQAFIHLGIPDYDREIEPFLRSGGSNSFNKIDQIPIQDLLMYNGLDSELEFQIMEIQKNAMSNSA